jgi:hypothetical protein
MRRALLVALGVLFVVRVQALGVLVMATSAGSSNAGDSVTSSAINTTGATLFVAVQVEQDTSFNTFSDSQGMTWNALTSQSGTNNAERVVYATGTGTGSHTFSIGTGGGFPCLAVIAFSGMATVAVFGQQTGSVSDSVSTIQPGSITPVFNDAVLVLGVDSGGETLSSVNGGFAIPSNGTTAFVNGQHFGCGIAYLIQTTATAANPTATLTSTANTAAVTMGSFRIASLSSGVSHAGRRLRLGL